LFVIIVVGLYLVAERSGMYITDEGVSRESVLKQKLQMMRVAIDQYTDDKHCPPQSLQDLADAKYLREIPTDPMTMPQDWVTHSVKVELRSHAPLVGIDDVHSASERRGRDGTPYNSW
jgi:general secretion pathway protein G